jgi:alkylation response protein AidB-like acyl-CoA dehydrogenase
MGLCRGAHELIGQIDSDAARASAGELGAQLDTLRGDVLDFVREDSTDAGRAATLRGRCNELAVRITHAAVALHKGSALLADHPAQRLARESMFLLVWSCPGPVVDCTVDLLSGRV